MKYFTLNYTLYEHVCKELFPLRFIREEKDVIISLILFVVKSMQKMLSLKKV